MTKKSNKIKDNIIGDGLVTLKSALGEHKKDNRSLLFDENNKWISYNTSHLGLINKIEVYEKIKEWLK